MPTKIFVTEHDESVYMNEAGTSFSLTQDAEHPQLAQYGYEGTLDDGIDKFMQKMKDQIGERVYIE
jgi:hypothetical protein